MNVSEGMELTCEVQGVHKTEQTKRGSDCIQVQRTSDAIGVQKQHLAARQGGLISSRNAQRAEVPVAQVMYAAWKDHQLKSSVEVALVTLTAHEP